MAYEPARRSSVTRSAANALPGGLPYDLARSGPCRFPRRAARRLAFLPTHGHRFGPGVARLIHTQGSATGERHVREKAPGLALGRPAVHVVGFHLRDERLDVVAHEKQLVGTAVL